MSMGGKVVGPFVFCMEMRCGMMCWTWMLVWRMMKMRMSRLRGDLEVFVALLSGVWCEHGLCIDISFRLHEELNFHHAQYTVDNGIV